MVAKTKKRHFITDVLRQIQLTFTAKTSKCNVEIILIAALYKL